MRSPLDPETQSVRESDSSRPPSALFFPLHSSFSAVVSISSHGSLLLAHWGQQGLQGTVWTSNGLVPSLESRYSAPSPD
ncbi:hypothetical protein JMJ78_0009472 [Colletotrichum scovillei]|nr:hypothetical protein JMJ78_0009472 [Colletotrichum scovillei]